MGQKVKMGIAQQVDTTDFHIEAIDLLTKAEIDLRAYGQRIVARWCCIPPAPSIRPSGSRGTRTSGSSTSWQENLVGQ